MMKREEYLADAALGATTDINNNGIWERSLNDPNYQMLKGKSRGEKNRAVHPSRHAYWWTLSDPPGLMKFASRKTAKHVQYMQSRLTDIRQMETVFTSSCAKARALIEEHKKKMMEKIEREAQVLLSKVDAIERENTRVWNTQKKQCFLALEGLRGWSSSRMKFEEVVAEICSSISTEEALSAPDIGFSPSEDFNFGVLRTSPSTTKSTVTVRDEAIAHRYNTCMINLKNDLNESVAEIDSELKVVIVDERGECVYTVVKNLKDGRVEVNFYPLQAGRIRLYVSINSCPVKGTPRAINVIEGEENILAPALVFGEAGEEDGQFSRPWGVCCDRRGRILVTDRCNHRIQIFSEDGCFQTKFGEKGPEPGKFNRPVGIAVDRYDRIIVADKDNHRIQIFDSDGVYISHFGRSESEEEQLNYPWGVAVNQDCQIAVTEAKRHWVKLFSDTGILLRKCDFSADKGLPRGISCLPNGSFLVTDLDNHKVTLLDKDFRNPLSLGSPGSLPGQFHRPQGIACSDGDMFAISDCKNYRIQVFKNGVLYTIFGRQGADLGHFDAPQGIAFHPNGCLIVVDYGNSRIQVFNIQ